MKPPEEIEEGETVSHTRRFTKDDVEAFVELSEDEGYHHVVSQGDGALIVHGLLTATLPTKIGGELNFVARTMEFEFTKPVYTGEAIKCELTVENIEEYETKYELSASFVCRNGEGETVMNGRSEGVIFKGSTPQGS